VLVRAPGRVNLIGEHVDYNDGLVLPIAIERATYAVAGAGEKDRIQVYSATRGESAEIDLRDNPPPDQPRWDAYVRGVAAELAAAGVRLAGARLYIDSDVPSGAGLSSSAALEVAAALALLGVAGETLPPREVARICRRAEHRYAKVPCGIMDQFICAMGVAGAALLIDCRNEQATPIPWPSDGAVVLVIDSRCRHQLSDGTYAQRVRECALAAEAIRRAHPAVKSLRDAVPAQVVEQRAALPEAVFRRARHVVSEIQRTRTAAEALQKGDFAAFGKALDESHVSLRDDYAVSSRELDDLVDTVRGVPGMFGARMTGAGFGGCVVAVARREAVADVESAVRLGYDPRYGVTALVMVTRPSAGAQHVAQPPPVV
jgi:galactokinase